MKVLQKICLMVLFLFFICEMGVEPVLAKSNKNKNLQKYPELENIEKQGNGPPSWAPAHGYRRKFLYYPNHHVYYDASARRYFWLDAGVVKVGVKLPSWINLSGGGMGVELPRQTPIFGDFN